MPLAATRPAVPFQTTILAARSYNERLLLETPPGSMHGSLMKASNDREATIQMISAPQTAPRKAWQLLVLGLPAR